MEPFDGPNHVLKHIFQNIYGEHVSEVYVLLKKLSTSSLELQTSVESCKMSNYKTCIFGEGRNVGSPRAIILDHFR